MSTSAQSELKGTSLPSGMALHGETLRNVTEEACRRLHIPIERAQEVLSRAWQWEPINPQNAPAVMSDFHRLQELFAEAQLVVARHTVRVEERNQLRAYLTREASELARDISTHLSMAERPVEVLRALFERGSRGLSSGVVSSLLGIREEVVGGDILRHPKDERQSRFGHGGFMYQPSEPYEVWQVFTLLNIKPGSLFYDLGSGYGHVLFLGAITRPDVRFKGVELMSARVEESEEVRARHNLSNVSFVAGDVTQGEFSEADIIFLFNPFPPDTMGLVADKIERIARSKPLVVVDYGGFVTQRVSNLTPLVVRDLEPYRVVCSRPFLRESCELIGCEPPKPGSRRGTKN